MAGKSISLDGVHDQLIDINNGIRSFVANILITPPTDEIAKEYSVGIGTQSQIDNKKDITFSLVKGVYKKSFTHTPANPSGDADVFYIIMSSQQPVNNINVQIDLKDTQPPPVEKPAPVVVPQKPVLPPVVEAVSNRQLYLKYLIAAVIVIIGVYFLYKFWKNQAVQGEDPFRYKPYQPEEQVSYRAPQANIQPPLTYGQQPLTYGFTDYLEQSPQCSAPTPVQLPSPQAPAAQSQAPAKVPQVPSNAPPVRDTKPTFTFY